MCHARIKSRIHATFETRNRDTQPGDPHQSHVRLLTRHCTTSYVFAPFAWHEAPFIRSPVPHRLSILWTHFVPFSIFTAIPKNIDNARPSNLSRIIQFILRSHTMIKSSLTFRCQVLLCKMPGKWYKLRDIALLLIALLLFFVTASREILSRWAHSSFSQSTLFSFLSLPFELYISSYLFPSSIHDSNANTTYNSLQLPWDNNILSGYKRLGEWALRYIALCLLVYMILE